MPTPMTLTQKILAHHAKGAHQTPAAPGTVLRIAVDWTLASELAWNGMNRTYEALGRPRPHHPERFYLAVDHTVDPVTLATDERTRRLVELSRSFAKAAGLRHFYDANETILHTKFYRDLVQPGQVVLGADSHTSSHGGMGAFAIGLGGADITAAMVLGETWIEVPEAIAIEYHGAPDFGISGKDIILATLAALGRNTVALERSVEYRGDSVRHFSVDTRFTIANMTAELGGLNGIFEADDVVAAWLATRPDNREEALFLRADDNAPYAERRAIDLRTLGPLIAKPFSPDNVARVEELAGLPLDGCFIGACTTTEEELVMAGLLLEAALAGGATPVTTARRLVVPGDREIERTLAAAGLLGAYERAGFRVGPPGCSMCLGIASERAGEGEVWLSSQNRNYHNRMGKGSLAYLSSAVTVAASALEMTVRDPRRRLAGIDRDRYAAILRRDVRVESRPVARVTPAPVTKAAAASGAPVVAAAPDRPREIRGRAQLFGDHVDTDAIIPGEFCHLTAPEELGTKCFHHIRPDFARRVRDDDESILVAGEGWGTGSSREQAAWALLGAGVKAIIAKSFAYIHKRNLVNDALPFVVLREARFYEEIQDGAWLTIDGATNTVTVAASGRRYQGEACPAIVAELQRHGGLVAAIRTAGAGVFARLQSDSSTL
ncbi:MAG: 3-isopropylmalate dehydratase [Candidatus Schekmanbacteria bacterium]|nr:3-isopropylmalate dehydratase [Candidatus Schekmanbacteria bacterium]